MKTKLTVHQRVANALKENRGIRLSPEDVEELMRDGAIAQRAEMDDMNDEGTKDRDIY